MVDLVPELFVDDGIVRFGVHVPCIKAWWRLASTQLAVLDCCLFESVDLILCHLVKLLGGNAHKVLDGMNAHWQFLIAGLKGIRFVHIMAWTAPR